MILLGRGAHICYNFAHNQLIFQEKRYAREDQNQQAMFSYVSPEARVPKDHPLRPIRIMVDNALVDLAPYIQGDVFTYRQAFDPAGTAFASPAAANPLLHPQRAVAGRAA